MIKGNVIMLSLSIIVILFLIVFGVILTLETDIMYLIPVAALVGYLIYTIYTFFNECKTFKSDETEGIREGVLQFRRVYFFRSTDFRNFGRPGISVGQFRVVELDSEDKLDILGKWISLTGNFGNVKLVKNKRYRAQFYVNSRQLVSIETEHM
jgi:Ca2+/Na+ antiporter